MGSDLTAEIYLLLKKMEAFGESKFQLKQKALAEGKPFNHYYHAKIFSISSLLTYKDRLHRFASWCKEHYQITSIRGITVGMFREYTQTELARLKPAAIRVHLAAITKMAEGIGKAESFHRVSNKAQKTLPDVEQSRPTYVNHNQALLICQKLAQSNPRHALAMELQMETGCRLVELDRLRNADLLGFTTSEGKTFGQVNFQGKGGRARQLLVSEQLYNKLQNAFTERIRLIDYGSYRSAVYHASKSLGLKSGGTHKARRLAVREMAKDIYRALRARGLTSAEASKETLQEINRQLGHGPNRMGITKLYLRQQ